jgi:3-hydroxy-9,10-secoandrosta-1,3,5(10)-triene-9,17-dione monooxygenase reductase component
MPVAGSADLVIVAAATTHAMDSPLTQAIGQIPSGLFILTAAYNGSRSGVLVAWVQQCATRPPLVMAAVSTTMPVVPLIRDSRSFVLCQVAADDRFLAHKFNGTTIDHEDPFLSLPVTVSPNGAPILQSALSWLDCEVIRHIDLESDYGLYVGRVRHGGMLNSGKPAIRAGDSNDVGR